MSGLDDLPDDLVLELSREKLGPEVLRLRRMLEESQQRNQAKRKKMQHYRAAFRKQHANFKALVARVMR